MNIIARLDFELAYYDSEVHRFNYYSTRTLREYLDLSKKWKPYQRNWFSSDKRTSLPDILNKSWRQHPRKQQLYGHLPPTMKTIQIRRTRHAGHYLGSKDELTSDVLLWTTSHGRGKVGRPAKTYIQQLCADRGCCLEYLLGAMDDRDGWRERVREIRINTYLYSACKHDCR